MLKYIIKDNEAGFVFKHGIFQKMVLTGTYRFPFLLGYEVVREEMTGELEYLERICEKVNEISVNGNAGIIEQLGKVMGTGR